MKNLIFILNLFLMYAPLNAQEKVMENRNKVVLITLDGLRWQELFTGADPKLIANKEYVSDTTSLKAMFWKNTAQSRREVLFPFIWNKIEGEGEIHGNRNFGSKVDLTNHMWFSYPGYNEILTGKADDENIRSNDKIYNPNMTILEKLNRTEQYSGKVAAFASWDVFPYIINDKRSGIPVNAGFDSAKGKDLTVIEQFLNKTLPHTPSPWGSVRLDMFTHNYALEYMKRKHPDIVYISYGETDDFAHGGNYQAYLKSAHSTDEFLRELWDYTQADPYYRNKTTFIVTTDHGRGTEPLDTWKSHGSKVDGAGEVWLMLYGAGVEPLGEVKEKEQLYTTHIVNKIYNILD
ncbi:phosphoglycerate mutase [Gillisia sp. Hel_I_86]|uniref:alkaline phosphatase family protein n=1 Tax=Gillisia sp. Hel_I_86 TaxID=1249981 RepID=UPI00119AA989|nr:alkaline phosphatase family protein [Gillisia sp. Hel_I_86]TVZ25860.1 phosphoglycerate mutase [Gillisia sp. Hel_I_86]